MVEASVEDEVGAECIAECPKDAHGVAAGAGCAVAGGRDEGLGEVPELTGDFELVVEGLWEEIVGDRDGLAILGAADWVVSLLGEDEVGVVVEAAEVTTDENETGLGEAADVDVGCGAAADATNVADGDGWGSSGLFEEDALDTQLKVAGVLLGGGGTVL